MKRFLCSGLLGAAIAAAPLAPDAQAQQAPCLANHLRPVGSPRDVMPPPDYASSQIWQQLATMSDAQMMQRLVGVWQTEQFNAPMGLMMRTQFQFDANGLFQYQDQNCPTNGLPCSQNGGPGEFRASRQSSGTTFIMVRFSDLSRTNQCFSLEVNFQDERTMIGRGGGVWRRIQ